MRVLVMNGSPKAQLSVSLQSIKYLEIKNPNHSFEQVHIISAVRKGSPAIKEAIERVENADLVLWTFPLYHLLVPAHMKLFIERIFDLKLDGIFKDKFASTFTTSIHFYDNVAHDYMESVCNDLGMKYLSGLSHDMGDLKKEDKRSELDFYFSNLVDDVQRNVPLYPRFKPLKDSGFVYEPTAGFSTDTPPVQTSKRTVIVTDANDKSEPESNIVKMISKYKDSIDGPVEVVNLNDINFSQYCIGCCNCATQNKCVFDDRDAYRKTLDHILDQSDIIIFASEIKDRYFGYKIKQFFDRSFCYTHIPIFSGKQMGYLVSGPVGEIPHMHEIMYCYASESTNLSGIVSDECADGGMLDRLIHEFARKSVHYAENNYIKTEMFQAVAGKMIFSDAISDSLGGLFIQDYKYYKAHGYFDKPPVLAPVRNAFIRFLLSRNRIRESVNKEMQSHMVSGHKKVLESISR